MYTAEVLLLLFFFRAKKITAEVVYTQINCIRNHSLLTGYLNLISDT